MQANAIPTKILLMSLLVFVLASGSAAQQAAAPALQGTVVDGMGLPGQMWTSVGNLSAVEHNNGYFQSYVEQDAAVLANQSGSLSLTPYVSLGLTADTKRYNWNNQVEPQMGVKVNKMFAKGLVS